MAGRASRSRRASARTGRYRRRRADAVSTEAILAIAAVGGGSLVQSATGFGYAIVAAPLLTIAYGPFVTAPTLAVLALLVNTLTLTSERRRLRLRRGLTVRLTLWTLPGMVLGAVLLARAPEDALRLLVAVAVLAAVAALLVTRRAGRPPDARPRPAHDAAAGLVSGAFGTSTGIGGPPVVLHLLHQRLAPDERRDTLAAVFLATGVVSMAVFALSGTMRLAPAAGVLAISTLAGHVVGRAAFARLDAHHDAVTIAVLLLGVAGAVVPAIQALS